MPRSNSLHHLIVYYFTVTSLVTFLLLGSYVIYDYREELKRSLYDSLSVMGEDIIEHGLYHAPSSTLKESFHYFEDYHNRRFVALFDQLTFTYSAQPVEDDNEVQSITRLPDGRHLIISSGLRAIDEKTTMFGLKHLTVFGTVLLLFILVFHLVLKRLFRPLRCLVGFCDDSSPGSIALPTCEGTQEINELKKAIVKLMQTNKMLCESRQDLFKEAAHEIKSPIAILKARLSLFQQRDDYSKGAFIEESLEDIATITHRLKELLFLKALELDIQKDKETISVKEQYERMQRAFQPILEKKGITIETDLKEDFTLEVQREAMTKVMQAIFENIFMHTKNGSVIKDHIDPKRGQMRIINEIGSKNDETLFSSYIGSKMIVRLSDRLGYTYTTSYDKTYFYTTITFHDPSRIKVS